MKHLFEENETMGLRYGRMMENYYEMYKPIHKSFKYDKLLPIQNAMLDLLESQTERQVTWIYDKIGGCGKSCLADYLTDRGDTFWCGSGGYKDIIYSFSKDPKKNVVIDLMRCTEARYVPYEVIESLKGGRAQSNKYNSKSICFEKCNVIVLSNTIPDCSKMSLDRWDIHQVIRSVETPMIVWDGCDFTKKSLNEGNTNLVLEMLSVTKCKEIENEIQNENEKVFLIDEM